MKNIKHIFSFGDSHIVGDELCSPDIPPLVDYLKTVQTDEVTGSIKVPQRNLDKIYNTAREIYHDYFHKQKQDFKLLENYKSFSGYLSRIYKCPLNNYAESGSSNLQSYIKFNKMLPAISEIASNLKNDEKILVIYGLTEIERSTSFLPNGKVKPRSPLWNLHNEHRKDAEKYIELLEKFGDDTLAKLFKVHMQINAVLGLLPDNCDVIFVDPAGLFIDRNTNFKHTPFVKIQSYQTFIDNRLSKITEQVMVSIRENLFSDYLYSNNVCNKFKNQEDFLKLMPMSHFTEQHHEIFSALIYEYYEKL